VSSYERLGVDRVINASGMMTRLGGALLAPEVARAMADAGAAHVDLDELKTRAGKAIAGWTGAEAAWPTSGAAAGIAIMTAAVVAGADPSRVARLPDADWAPRTVLVQAGHWVDFGAPVEQMVRLGGGRPVLVGSVNRVTTDDARGALASVGVAAVLFVQSHHAVQQGMLTLTETVALARERAVPVLVDAAAEEDLRRYVTAGADLVAYSGGKAFGGPTSGFVAGRVELVAACRAQERGIARAMKVGKEAIVGLLAALDLYVKRDGPAEASRQAGIVATLREALGRLPHTRVAESADEAGRGIVRLTLSPDARALGFGAADLVRTLASGAPGRPRVMVRAHGASTGTIALDPRPLTAADVPVLVEAIRAAYDGLRGGEIPPGRTEG
jgi:L-seryl-tRNA(Ser) seleniumtransferase/D-glucosaminate-6-phosphate ammonia-lyase